MKGYCPNCGRYMAAVRRENKQLLHLICEPCEDLLWRDKPRSQELGLEPIHHRPPHTRKIVESAPDAPLIIEPARDTPAD